MRDVVILFVHLVVTVVRLSQPGGLRSVIAASVLVKDQLRILNRGRKRAPNLGAAERMGSSCCPWLKSWQLSGMDENSLPLNSAK